MSIQTTRQVHLAARPDGELTPAHLRVVEVPLPGIGDGEVLVRNDHMLMATAYRDLMNEVNGLPIPSFQIGEPLHGRTVGTVVRSASPDLAEGDLVEHFFGWREHVAGPAEAFRRQDRDLLPGPEYFLANGPTAWRGMVDVAGVREGDVVFVSGATSGVGSVAGQIARNRGAKLVIGSTGSPAKVDYLVNELGFDAAIDYTTGSVADRLRELAPEGITVYFDNVGGEQFEAAVAAAGWGARFALCGAMSQQLGGSGTGLDLMAVIGKQIRIEGFACFHTPEQIDTWNEAFSGWLRQGTFVYPHTVVEGGLTAAPQALIDLLARRYSGNVIMKL